MRPLGVSSAFRPGATYLLLADRVDRVDEFGEVFAVAREQFDPTVRLQGQRPITVELELVRPGRSFW